MGIHIDYDNGWVDCYPDDDCIPPMIDAVPISSDRFSEQMRREYGYDEMHRYIQKRKQELRLRGEWW